MMIFVLIGWVMFCVESVSQALLVYAGMLGANGLAPGPETMLLTRPSELLFLMLGCLLSVNPVAFFAGRTKVPVRIPSVLSGTLTTASSLGLFLLCAVALHARSESPFLYFQF
jgi:alginate O-acetyltransferase complex protein AlgI